jgi:hypothetical protein
MNVYHPLNSIPEGAATWIVFAALLILSLALGKLAGPDLDSPEISKCNRRIIALERPASDADGHRAPDARGVIGEWAQARRLDAVRRSIWWDYGFILAYTTLTALGCVIAARAFFAEGSPEYKAVLLIAWLPWLAGLFDCVENYAMLRMLGGFEGETLPQLAWWCATVKFGIILPLAAWVFVSLVLLGLKYVIGRWRW